MNISKIKLVWKFLTGGREAVLDYILEIANNLVGKLATAKQDEIKGYLSTAQSILTKLDAYSWLCPSKWQKAYTVTLAAFADVIVALEDLKVTPGEVNGVIAAFQNAYCSWHTDDEVKTVASSGECADGACAKSAE
jgi:hypothetical protein